MIPRLLLSSGEPAGVGPDLCLQVATQSLACDLIVIGDIEMLAERARQLGIPIELKEVDGDRPAQQHLPGTLKVWSQRGEGQGFPGRLEVAQASHVLKMLDEAARATLAGRFDALVTAPVHKGIINEAGYPFTGHTEYLASLTGGYPVMLLTGPGLRVALATTHLPLAEVSRAITSDRLQRVLRVLHGDLRHRFGLPDPHILVCGLNPHAGEGGHLGREEIEIIEPVLASLRGEGFNLTGPLPADTLFVPSRLAEADAVLAMYHDQGLPVLKHLGFGRAVNITLGLPIIRTSVDHGTALELAGTGRADSASLEAAIETAIRMVRYSRPHQGEA